MREEIIAYVYDFLSMLFENPGVNDKIKEVILFGSVAKNTFDKESDVDIFFNINDEKYEKDLEETIKRVQKSFEIKSERTWKIKKITFPINFIVGSLNSAAWKNLREEIASSGIILYSNYKELPGKTNHYYLIYYSLNNLQRKDKMKLIRELFGYSLKKLKIEYTQKGILNSIGGRKLGSNVILVPSIDVKKIKDIFKENKVSYKILDAWIRE
ncbi:nucleotidyltransferase domain-containing protein [Candidatus Pacearchaeota archaeon]|nr:nucleotidyltransferase domain-containing protein [Candidatus Pacearchaeota archaeon]